MKRNLWALVIAVLSAVILLDLFEVIAIGEVFEIVLVIGLVIMLVLFIRSRKKPNG